MKKHTEKTPIDDLFARKLGNASLPVSPGGFERLQARMGQNVPEARVVIWRNSTIQRYVAIAACLVLVCSFGWLYWPPTETTTQVATNQPTHFNRQKPVEKRLGDEPSAPLPTDNTSASAEQNTTAGEATLANESSDLPKRISDLEPKGIAKASASNPPEENGLALAPTKPNETKSNADAVMPNTTVPLSQPTEQVAESKPAIVPTPIAERVLVVTIAEPEALVAARQVIKTSSDEKPIVAVDDKLEKETKGGSLWQQVKRIKQGDVFARGNNAEVESSLLGRAYNGLKHSLDRDKSAKQ